jgi:hypothetical protein
VPGTGASDVVAVWLRELYPPGAAGEWLGALRPDRLAELHATRELEASAELAQSCLTGLDDRQARRALILLARASDELRAARALLEPALFRFSAVVAGIDAPRETMIAIANAIPYPSVALDEADAKSSTSPTTWPVAASACGSARHRRGGFSRLLRRRRPDRGTAHSRRAAGRSICGLGDQPSHTSHGASTSVRHSRSSPVAPRYCSRSQTVAGSRW